MVKVLQERDLKSTKMKYTEGGNEPFHARMVDLDPGIL